VQATTFVIDNLSDTAFISYISQNDPDIVVFCGNYYLLYSQNDKNFTKLFRGKVIIHTHSTIDDIHTQAVG